MNTRFYEPTRRSIPVAKEDRENFGSNNELAESYILYEARLLYEAYCVEIGRDTYWENLTWDAKEMWIRIRNSLL